MNHERAILRQRRRRRFSTRRRLGGKVMRRPRLSVFRSHRHIYVQVIDDLNGRTLAAASSAESDLRSQVPKGWNKEAAQQIGKAIAERALAAGVRDVVFDRREYKYHGRIAALADAAREGGLNF